MLLESRNNSITEYLHNCFFPSRQKGQSETKAIIGKGAVTHVSPERGLFGHFDLDSVLVFVTLQTCLEQWFCFCFAPPKKKRVRGWYFLVPIFCEIADVRQNSLVELLEPESSKLTAVRGYTLLSHHAENN